MDIKKIHFKPENFFFTKLRVDLNGRAKIETFTPTTTRLVHLGDDTLNNRYTPLTVTPADCHKHFQLKLWFCEHI